MQEESSGAKAPVALAIRTSGSVQNPVFGNTRMTAGVLYFCYEEIYGDCTPGSGIREIEKRTDPAPEWEGSCAG